MKKLLVVIFISFIFCGNALASGLATVSDVEKSTEAAMKLIKKGDMDQFVGNLKQIWKMPEKEMNNAMGKLVAQKKQTEGEYGKTLDVQYVDTQVVADTLIKINYIQKFENAAMRWTFIYYKPATEWYLNTFVWDDQVPALFK